MIYLLLRGYMVLKGIDYQKHSDSTWINCGIVDSFCADEADKAEVLKRLALTNTDVNDGSNGASNQEEIHVRTGIFPDPEQRDRGIVHQITSRFKRKIYSLVK